jgi:hypothetical protein
MKFGGGKGSLNNCLGAVFLNFEYFGEQGKVSAQNRQEVSLWFLGLHLTRDSLMC